MTDDPSAKAGIHEEIDRQVADMASGKVEAVIGHLIRDLVQREVTAVMAQLIEVDELAQSVQKRSELLERAIEGMVSRFRQFERQLGPLEKRAAALDAAIKDFNGKISTRGEEIYADLDERVRTLCAVGAEEAVNLTLKRCRAVVVDSRRQMEGAVETVMKSLEERAREVLSELNVRETLFQRPQS